MEHGKKDNLRRDAVILTGSKLMVTLITMVSAMLLSRFRTLEEYGSYAQILLMVNLALALFMLGLPNSVNYFYARAESQTEQKTFLSTYYVTSSLLGLVGGLLLMVMTPVIAAYFKNPILREFGYFFALYPWAKIIGASVENVLVVSGRTKLLIFYRLLHSGALLGLIVVIELLDMGFYTYMYSFLGVEAVFALSVYVLVHFQVNRLSWSLNLGVVKQVFVYAVPIGLASVVGTIQIQLDKLIIGRYLPEDQMAIYTNASKELPITIVAVSLTAVLLPQLAKLLKKNQVTKALDLWGHTVIVSYILIAYVVAAFFIYAPDVMTALYSEKYVSGVGVFRVYQVLMLLRCTYFGIVLNARGKTSFILYSSIVALVVNVVFNVVLFRVLGFIGPAIATVLSSFMMNISQLVATSRVLKVPFRHLLPYRALVSISLINGLLGLIFYWIKRWVVLEVYTGEILESIILSAAFGLIYLVVIYKPLFKHYKAIEVTDT